MSDATHAHTLGDAIVKVRASWGWFVALGIGLLILGIIAAANLLTATVASVLFVGVLMLIGGVAQIVLAFRVKTWGRFLFWLLSGILYAAGGVLAFVNPLLASTFLTLLLAFSLIFAGALRISVGFGTRPDKGWGWIVAAGVLTALAGIVIAVGWPVNSVWVLGLFLAVDLMFQGWSYIAFGLALRARA
jgi:uncharacterized membrane protein HdeD (DUF308 family)